LEKGLRTQARRVLLHQVAPAYHNASASHKQQMLEEFVTATGYVRKYARWLLNHAEEVLVSTTVLRRRYGPEVEQALVLAWKTLNRICTKRLIPFLPSIIEALEQDGHVQLSQEHRRLLLSMSAATADRLLQAHRYSHPRSLSTTKAGSLLKQQIPVRTFAQWDEAQPGFLEADLVAHCGGRLQGGCLYTLTLTDISTGWTECLPLLNRGREAVLAALQRARTLFPFPILGIDTDNGGEFINEEVAAYCVREQITFTRGRPYEKRDQCFVEQKNGVVVRQVVGHGRLAGEHAYQQLAELYRALRLFVNCFQPSMKLVAKHIEGRNIHRVYDVARTPLQRLLLSGVLTASRQQELSAVAKGLDPIRLFRQVEQLQQAIFRCEESGSAPGQRKPGLSLLRFELEGNATKPILLDRTGQDEGPVSLYGDQKSQESMSVLDWRRTSNDPFIGQWEQILAWVRTNPTRSSGDIFRELQSLFPGRFLPRHMRTLQRGMRRIRKYVLATREEPQQREVIHGDALTPHHPEPAPKGTISLSVLSTQSVNPSQGEPSTCASHHRLNAEAPTVHPSGKVSHSLAHPQLSVESKPSQAVHASHIALAPAIKECHDSPPRRGHSLSIERAIQSYLQAHRKARHRPKTLEWHPTALCQFQHYLQVERHLLQVSQITETDVRDWVSSMRQTPTPAGKQRSTSTIETYARSVRAFCAWLVYQGALPCSPMSEGSFPRADVPLPHVVSPETFEQFVQAGFPPETKALTTRSMVVRDRALLWVLFDTGLRLSEVCALRLGDVDQKTGILSVRKKGGNVRRMTLGSTCLSHLLLYLERAHPALKGHMVRRKTGDDPLFFSEQDHALTKNGVTSLVSRLQQRAGMSDVAITPQLLRHSFALRYLQAGGNPQGLQELLGYEGMAPVRQYLRWQQQLFHNQTRRGEEPKRYEERDEKSNAFEI
jgi:site-specific recombinase XerD